MTNIEIAEMAMDDAELVVAQDFDFMGVDGSQPIPPDLIAHDKKYHPGGYKGGKCKYRENRAAALEGKAESDWGDIIDKLNPEDVDGEEIDKADDLTNAEPNVRHAHMHSATLNGDAVLVEAAPSNGDSKVIGDVDKNNDYAEIIESALNSSGLKEHSPFTINVSSNVGKVDGKYLELPMAMMAAERSGAFDDKNALDYMAIGALTMTGEVLSPKDPAVVTNAIIEAQRIGKRGIFIPRDNAEVAAKGCEGVNIYPVTSLSEVVGALKGDIEISPLSVEGEKPNKKNVAEERKHKAKETQPAVSKEEQEGAELLKKAPNDLAKSIIQGVLNKIAAKKESDKTQKLLDAMSEYIDWTGWNSPEANKEFGNEYQKTMERLAELVKSGALNEMLGLGGGKAQGQANGGADNAQLKARRDQTASYLDSLKEQLTSGLCTADLAGWLNMEIGGVENQLKEMDAKLAGKSYEPEMSEKDKRKAKKKAEKEAKKAAVSATKAKQGGAATTLDSASDVSSDKSYVLSSDEFKKEMSSLSEKEKIFALSDFHDATLKDIDPSGFGTMIIAGDFTKHGATSHSKNIDMAQAVTEGNAWLDKKFRNFCNKHPNQQFVCIAGNHDHFLGDPSADNIQWPSNVAYLKDSEANVNGMRVYGTPWCEKRKGAAKTASMGSSVAQQPFEIDDDAIKEKFDKIPEGLDILVVHQTPKADGYDGDLAFVGGEMKHCGSEALTEAIKRAKPKLVICGHLHDGDHRPFRIGDSVVVNGAYVANRGDPSWTAHEIGMRRAGTEAGTTETGFILDGENNHQLNNKAI